MEVFIDKSQKLTYTFCTFSSKTGKTKQTKRSNIYGVVSYEAADKCKLHSTVLNDYSVSIWDYSGACKK